MAGYYRSADSKFIRCLLVPGLILVMGAFGTAAWADPATDASVSTAPSGTASDSGSLAEIIVTAQKRAERNVDVPLSIVIVGGSELQQAGVVDTRDLTLVTPGLKVDRLGLYTQTAIRGVSSGVADPGTEANIAYYVDGVYQPSQLGLTFDFLDIDHVEVDKGPQGTLFGRNATGGAIQIFTELPSFTPKGSFSAGWGNIDSQEYKGILSGPLYADELAGSIAVAYNGMGGYFENLSDGGGSIGDLSSFTIRGKLLWKPADFISVLGTIQHVNRIDTNSILGQPLNGNTLGRVFDTSAPIASQPYQVSWGPVEPIAHQTNTQASLKADVTLGYGTLSSITGYTTNHVDSQLPGDYSPAALATYELHIPDKYWSQELQFAARKIDGFSWVGGLFFFDGYESWDPLEIPQDSFVSYGTQRDRSYAVYGQGDYDITENLVAIAGVRVSRERKELDGSFGYPDGTPIADLNTELGSKTWDSVTPRASLRYSFTPDTNVYFTYSQGFKSGGFVVASLNKSPYDPEKLDAYEVGFKTAGRSYSFDAAAFYYNYRDQQVNTTAIIDGAPLGVVGNAASSRIYGLDIDAIMHVTEEFRVNGALELLSAKYKDYQAADVNAPATVSPLGGPCTLCGNQSVVENVTGNDMIRAPDWTLSITPEYVKTLTAGKLDLTATLFHTAKYYFDPNDRLAQPQYTSLNARASWEFWQSGFEVALWGRNLTNRVIYSGAFETVLADGMQLAPPRTYGGEFSYRF